jgi:hypothetical protein
VRTFLGVPLLIYWVHANFGNPELENSDDSSPKRNDTSPRHESPPHANVAGCVVRELILLHFRLVVPGRLEVIVLSEIVVVLLRQFHGQPTRYTVLVHRAGQRTGMHMHRVSRLSAMEMQCNLMQDV